MASVYQSVNLNARWNKHLSPKEIVTLRDALLSEIIQFETLVNLLD